MIELKRCNYITGDSTSVSFGVSEIVKFLELAGRNIILLTKPKQYDSSGLKYFIHNKLEYKNQDEFESLVENKSNLFRVDLIVADLWHLSVDRVSEYKHILSSTGIDFVIIAQKYHYKDSDSVTDYHIKRESSLVGEMESSYIITNKINGWSTDLNSLIKSYIRDEKINNIIGD